MNLAIGVHEFQRQHITLLSLQYTELQHNVIIGSQWTKYYITVNFCWDEFVVWQTQEALYIKQIRTEFRKLETNFIVIVVVVVLVIVGSFNNMSMFLDSSEWDGFLEKAWGR